MSTVSNGLRGRTSQEKLIRLFEIEVLKSIFVRHISNKFYYGDLSPSFHPYRMTSTLGILARIALCIDNQGKRATTQPRENPWTISFQMNGGVSSSAQIVSRIKEFALFIYTQDWQNAQRANAQNT